MLDDVSIGDSECLIKFSNDGSLFAYYCHDKSTFRVIELKDNNI